MLRRTMGRIASCSSCAALARGDILVAGASIRSTVWRRKRDTHKDWSWRCCYSTQAISNLPRTSFTTRSNSLPRASTSRGTPIDDDHKAEHAFREAVQTLKTPHQLRLFFVHLLVNDHVPSPISTWETYRDAFAHDFILASDNINVGVNQTLEEIGRALEEHGKSLGAFGLPEPTFHSREVEHELARWDTDLEVLGARAAKAAAKLNAEQYAVYSEILDAVSAGRPLCAFVDGKAGRGKTFLVNAICNKVRSLGQIVLPTATSAFAAQLYPGGKTTHSTFRVPISDDTVLTSPVEAHDPRGELIREAAVIIWDEAPMANSAVLACVEETCRRVMKNDLPFGGKVFLLLGDFRQTCPVIRHGTRRQIVDASISSSPLWSKFTVYRLSQPIRNAEDLPFADFVDAIGDGGGPEVPLDLLQTVNNGNALIDFVYPELVLQDPVMCLKRAILAPTNSQVDKYNNEILGRITGVQRTYVAADALQEGEEVDPVPTESILEEVSRKTPPGVPVHALTVKVNGVYRLMCNFSPDRGLVKNTRVVVIAMGKRIVTVRILRGIGGVSVLDAEDILISRISFTSLLESGHTLVRRQFPLSPAYATTFNSCQGLTLDVVGVDLTRPVFSHGQLYTALSRIRHRTHARLRLRSGHSTTRNVTYHEILP